MATPEITLRPAGKKLKGKDSWRYIGADDLRAVLEKRTDGDDDDFEHRMDTHNSRVHSVAA